MKPEATILEWGGAEPLPRTSFQWREKGGATEDPVLCLCVCPSGPPKRKKWKFRDFSHFGLKSEILASSSAKTPKMMIFGKSGPKMSF